MYKRIKISALLCVFATGLFMLSCNKDKNTPTPKGTAHHKYVSMHDMSFDPATLTVSEGDTVTWINPETVPHIVTSGTASGTTPHPDGKFDSGNMEKGDEFTLIFSSSKGLGVGTYPYYCLYHLPEMKGTIIVN